MVMKKWFHHFGPELVYLGIGDSSGTFQDMVTPNEGMHLELLTQETEVCSGRQVWL